MLHATRFTKRSFSWLVASCQSRFCVPAFLFIITILAYGVLIPWLGFYSDDWLFIWTGQKIGAAGLTRYFSTNRPVWGLMYQVSMSILGSSPLAWQIFGLLSRWAAAVACWWMLSSAAPGQSRRTALWASLLLLVYPGFKLAPIAITFGHLFLVMAVFFTSIGLSIQAISQPKRRALFSAVALALSAINLLSMEYFFVLDLVRPLFFFLVLGEITKGKRALNALKLWLPYLALFFGVLLWRAFFFPYQTHNYQLSPLSTLRSEPLSALASLIQAAGRDLYAAAVLGWSSLVTELPLAVTSKSTLAVFLLLVIITAFVTGIILWFAQAKNLHSSSNRFQATWWLIAATWLVFAGAPFIVTGLKVGAVWFASRFTIPYILGTALLISLLLSRIHARSLVPLLMMAVLVGLSAGNHFLNANQFRHDWENQKRLYWQMVERIPALQPGTTLVVNEQRSLAGSNTYLTVAVNWMYAEKLTSDQIPYQMVFVGDVLPDLLQNTQTEQIQYDYLSGVFRGPKANSVVLFYNGRCLQVLDSTVDRDQPLLDDYLRQAVTISSPDMIATTPMHPPDISFMGPKPAPDWCTWYERADLARQRLDWDQVVQIGDAHLGDEPLTFRAATTVSPFIEGYAHANQWQKSLDLSTQAARITIQSQQDATLWLCDLWARMEDDTPQSPEKFGGIIQFHQQFQCEQ